MKKFLYICALIATLLTPAVVVVGGAHAVDVLDPVCQNADPNNLPTVCKENAAGSTENPLFGPRGIITRATELLARFVGLAAVIAIIIYGLKFVSSGSDAGEAKSARQGVLYALVGLVVAVLAQGIVTFILNRL